ncbi:uncharacterized protein LOC107794937 isoform X2 [Nicotiana tabacum]|uniref:Uncharacterized protein LOC107794937 isoform X2 n=1 Tax=Nicotiana tabacum TaxID=4097 RepID=A0AC58THF3_TOBAC
MAVEVGKANEATVMLTSGASGRVSALFSLRMLRSLWLLLNAFLLLFLLPFRGRRRMAQVKEAEKVKVVERKGTFLRVPAKMVPRKSLVDQEVAARRALAIRRVLQDDDKDTVREFSCFGKSIGDTMFTQSWTPLTTKVRGLVFILHGLNEHSGRYNDFAKKLNASGLKVYGMDWIVMHNTRRRQVAMKFIQRLDEEAGEGTSQVPPANVDQHEPQNEVDSQASGAVPPPPPEGRRGANIPPGPLPVVPDQDLDMRSAVQLLTRIVASQAQHQTFGIADRSVSARVRDFINLDPPVFTGVDHNADPQDFLDLMQRTLQIIHATDVESVEFTSYRLRDVAVTWYETWKQTRGPNVPPVTWKEFSEAFLQQYLPIELRRARRDRFLHLEQGNMSVREYSMQFNSLARYAPKIVADMSDRVHQFVSGLGAHLINECTTASLNQGMDIARIQAYAQGLEDRKRQQRANREHDRGQQKRARFAGNIGEFRGGFRPQFPRRQSYPAASAPPQFQGQRQDRTTYSGPGQSSRTPGPQFRGEFSQMRPQFLRCDRCGRNHFGPCRQGSDACYTCGQPGHIMRHCPMTGGGGMAQPTASVGASSSSVRPPRQSMQTSAGRGRGRFGASGSGGQQNRIYALSSRQDLESSPDVVTGHGGSDGLHAYVPSLDDAVSDMKQFLSKILAENRGLKCFCFGHSTGAAIVLKASLDPKVRARICGVVLTSPAVGVQPAHPIFTALAPVVSFLMPRFQFSAANKEGVTVSRDPKVLLAKYSDPLVFTGAIRVRTGYEILRITANLQQNLSSFTIPFLVLHGTDDAVTDPEASKKLYAEALSTDKNIKLYDGLLHDLLFEPEREEIMKEIIVWLSQRL